MTDFKIDLQPIVGSDGVQVQAQAAQQGGNTNIYYNQSLKQSLGVVDTFLKKRRQEQLKSAIGRGRLAQEAGTADSEYQSMQKQGASKHELSGFDIGKNFQLGIQGGQQSLTAFSQKYQQAIRNGASDVERQQLYQDAVNTLGTGITELPLPAEYKQTLRKQALENLDLFVRVQQQADKQYAQEQYDQTRAQSAYALRSTLVGAAGIGDVQAARTGIKSIYESMLAAAHAAGHFEDARSRASAATKDAVLGLLQNFDVTDARQVQARNLLLQVGEDTLGQFLEGDDFNALQTGFSKAHEQIRDYNGLQMQFQYEGIEQRIVSGEAIPKAELQGMVNQVASAVESGKLGLSDGKRLLNQITGMAAKQWQVQAQIARDAAAANADGANSVQDMLGMSLAEALARGKETGWVNAQKQAAVLQAQGNLTQAGLQLLGVANINRSDKLAEEAAQMASRDFVYFLGNVSTQDYQNATGSDVAEAGFKQWFQMYRQADPAIQDAYLRGLGAENAALVQDALKAFPQATLGDVMRYKEQWKRLGGAERQKRITGVVTGSQKEWKDAFPTMRNSGLFGGSLNLYRDAYEEYAQDYSIEAARQVLQQSATQAVLDGASISSPEAAMAYLRSKGNIIQTPNQTIVLSDSNRQRLRQAIGVSGDSTLASEVMQKYLEIIAKKYNTEPTAVVPDATWDDAKRMRWLVFNKDGSSSVLFENYSDVAKVAKNLMAAKPKATPAASKGWSIRNPMGLTLPNLDKLQAASAPRAVSVAPAPQQIQRAVRQASQRGAAKRLVQGAPTAKAPAQQAPAQEPKKDTSRRSTRIQILQEELANEQRALAKETDATKRKDRELNIKAIQNELKRS